MSHRGLDQRYAGEEGQKDERQNWKLRSHVCLFIQKLCATEPQDPGKGLRATTILRTSL
jgi:hypothetical protein